MAPARKKPRAKPSPPVIEGEILSEKSPEETVVSEKSGKAGNILRRIGWYMAAAGVVFIAGLVAAPSIQERFDSLLGREAPAEAAPATPPAARPAVQEESPPAPVPEAAETTESEPEREAAEAPASEEQISETAQPEAEPRAEVPAADIPVETLAETQEPASEDYEKTIERLNARLDALEARLAKMEALGGAGVAGAGADRMLLALARLSQRLDAGQAYGGEMLEFSAFFEAIPASVRATNDSHMRVLAAGADSGIKNAAMLGRDFAAVLPAALAAAALPEDAGWWDRVWAGLKSVVVVRRVGQVEGAGSEAVLARAEFHLGEGDIAAALTEIQSLELHVQDVFSPWQADAAKSLAARRALKALIESYSASPASPTGGG